MAAVVNKAKFTINATAADTLGYDAAPGETLTMNLENTQGVLSVTYQTYDPADPNSPLASTGAPSLVFSNSLNSITPATPATAVTIAVFSSFLFSSSWILRATVTLDNGVSQVFERMVTMRLNRPRVYIPGEVTQYSLRGWGDAISQLIRDFNMYHAPAGIQTTGAGAATFASMLRGPRGCGYYVSAVFMASQLNTPNNTIYWFVEAAYASDATNVVTQRIAPAVVKKRDLSAGALVIPVDPTINIVSNQLQPAITGIAATTINWQVRWDIFMSSSITF
jgi:hypothetical protein